MFHPRVSPEAFGGGLKQGSLLKKFQEFIQRNGLKTLTGFSSGGVEKGTLKVFDRACLQAEGSIGPIRLSPYGFHIFRVKGKKPAKKLSFSEVEPQIQKRLLEEKEKRVFEAWLKSELEKTPGLY